MKDATPNIPALLTVKEASAYLAISPASVYRLVAHREIEHVLVGNAIRFTKAHLENFKHIRRI